MKIKNHYAWICAVWIITSILNCIGAFVCFENQDLGMGLLLLVFSVSFAFISGSLFEKAKSIYRHNKAIKKEKISFPKFEVPFPEVKKESDDE